MLSEHKLRVIDRYSRQRATITVKLYETSGHDTIDFSVMVTEAARHNISAADLLTGGRVVVEDNSYYNEDSSVSIRFEYQRPETDAEYENRLESLVIRHKQHKASLAAESRARQKTAKSKEIEVLKNLAVKYPDVAKDALKDL